LHRPFATIAQRPQLSGYRTQGDADDGIPDVGAGAGDGKSHDELEKEGWMALLDQIGGLLQQYARSSSNISREQARNDYDTIASAVPQDVLGSAIGPALSSLGREQVQERIGNSASEMTPTLRGQFLQALLNAVGGGGGSYASILSQLGIDGSVATNPQQASPDDVAKVAAHVHDTRPDAFNQAMGFFSEHPILVKVLGTMAIAKIAQHLSARAPQLKR